MLRPGTVIDHYLVMRLVGRGGMGEVFAARDLKLGRKVALKLVSREQFESDSMRERFLVEARTTARFNHPNIVTIYGVGEFEGSPYLALEYLEGETLADRLKSRRMSQGEALRVGLSVAEALAEAHRHGVLHRDLKPGNVHLGRDGRVRVLDFGLAKVEKDPQTPTERPAGDEPTGSAVFSTQLSASLEALETQTFGVGTPSYMAPEQWLEDPCSPATDVWAFGVVLFSMVTGRLPFIGTSAQELAFQVCGADPVPRVRELADVSQALDDLVDQCLRKVARERVGSAQLVERLHPLVEGRGRALREGVNPFRGLLPFTRADEHQFFGRDAEVAAFVERLRGECVLPVVGASGSGKSSFVQAGVVPRLLEQERWTILTLRTKADPYLALAARLIEGDDVVVTSQSGRGASDGPTRPRAETPAAAASEETKGRTSHGGSARPLTMSDLSDDSLPATVVTAIPIPNDRPSARTALAMTRSGSHRRDVAELAERLRAGPGLLAFELRALAEARNCRVLLFVDQVEELFTQGVEDATTRRFIETLCSATDDPLDPVRVVITIRDDFFGRLAVSPKVSTVLGRVMLMQRPDPRALEEILTGPIKALGYRYEDSELPKEMVHAVHDEPACLPLLQFTANLLWEKRDCEGRVLTRSAYVAIGGVEGALAGHADGVLAGFSESQLLVARKLLLRLVTPERTRKIVPKDLALEGLGSEAGVVLARFVEARMISTTKWLDPGATTVLDLAHESLIRNWRTLRRWVDESHEDVVLVAQLEQAARLWHERGRRDEQIWRGDALLEAKRIRARTASELPTQVREFVGASELADERQRRKRRRLFVGALVLAATIAGSSIVAAVQIARQRDEAERRRAESLREGARAAFAQDEILEARAKLRESLEVEDSVRARVLWRQLASTPLEWKLFLGARLIGVAYARDSKALAVASSDNTVQLIDTTTSAHRALRGHADQVLSVDYSSDGRVLASSSLDRTVRLWNVKTGELLHVLEGAKEATHTARFSPDSTRIASSTYAGDVHIWSVTDGRSLRSWHGHVTPVRGLAWSPDGKRLATGDASGNVHVWDPETGSALFELEGNDRTVYALAWSPDGRTLATSSTDGVARLFDVESRREVGSLRGHSSGLYRLAYSPDGKKLATAGRDRRVQLWDVDTRRVLASYPTKGEASDVAFSYDGRFLVTVSMDEDIQLFRTDTAPAGTVRTHDTVVNCAVLSQDGETVVSGGSDGKLIFRSAATGQVLHAVTAHQGSVNALASLDDGSGVMSGGGDGAIRLWGKNGEVVRTLMNHTAAIFAVAANTSSGLFVAGTADGVVYAIDSATGAIRKLGQGQDCVRSVAVDVPNGLVLASGHDGRVRTFSLQDGSPKREFDVAHGRIYGMSTNPGGKDVVVATADGSVVRLALESGEQTRLMKADTRCYQLGTAPDGSLAVPCADGMVRLLSRDGGPVRTVAVHSNEANTAYVSRDGAYVVTASDDFTTQLLDRTSLEPRWYANVLLPLGDGGAAMLSHRGWTGIGGAPLPDTSTAYRESAEKASESAISRDGSRLCVASPQGEVSLFDVPGDRLIARARVPTKALAATPRGCFALSNDTVVRLNASGELRIDIPNATVLGAVDEGFAVATQDRVVRFDGDGAETHSVALTSPVTAIGGAGDVLFVGHRDGHIERRDVSTGVVQELEGTNGSAVLSVLAGPARVWIAGFGNGEVGLWSEGDTHRLDHAWLHGPVTRLALSKSVVHAATTRGDSMSWDLGDLVRPHCELLAKVFATVPVLWREGRVERATALLPTDCR